MRLPNRMFVTPRGVMQEDEGNSFVAFDSAKSAIRYLDGEDLGFSSVASLDGPEFDDDVVEYTRVNREEEKPHPARVNREVG